MRNQTLENLLFGAIGFGLGALCVKAFGEDRSAPEPDFIVEQAPLPAEGIPVDPAAGGATPPGMPSTAVECHLCETVFDVEGRPSPGTEVQCPKCGNKTEVS